MTRSTKTILSILLLFSLPSCGWLTMSFWFHTQLTERELALIVNQADPLSVEIARYYQQKRGIPQQNIITINFPPNRTSFSPQEFQRLKAEVDGKIPIYVQALALTWAKPYRVGCMSITSAFAFGFDSRYCADGCLPTKVNPYFDSKSSHPYQDFKMRPTIAIAATNFNQAKQLIDRGVASDATYPPGTAYLMITSDRDRNIRASLYPESVRQLSAPFKVEILQADTLENRSDVMFYFTGLRQVDKIIRNKFLPGAIADHLTSFGGKLTDSEQMSSLRWLEAGATGSYGTVVEPCNFTRKFPHPGIMMSHYLQGDTLIEAYWKSVAWAGQGIFIGEPLARPFGETKK